MLIKRVNNLSAKHYLLTVISYVISEYVNFWMDAIHCYSENENCNGLSEQDDDKSEQNLPSVIVVGTCSDKLKVCNLFLDYIV